MPRMGADAAAVTALDLHPGLLPCGLRDSTQQRQVRMTIEATDAVLRLPAVQVKLRESIVEHFGSDGAGISDADAGAMLAAGPGREMHIFLTVAAPTLPALVDAMAWAVRKRRTSTRASEHTAAAAAAAFSCSARLLQPLAASRSNGPRG